LSKPFGSFAPTCGTEPHPLAARVGPAVVEAVLEPEAVPEVAAVLEVEEHPATLNAAAAARAAKVALRWRKRVGFTMIPTPL
jgi:hypothetical protein